MNPIYPDLSFPPAPGDRPYIYINMVATIDGKIVTKDNSVSIKGLGSKLDYETMRYIETCSDAVMVGAQNVRATPGMWYPEGIKRLVVTESGNLNYEQRFFTDDPANTWVILPQKSLAKIPEGIQTISFGESEIDWHQTLKHLKNELGITHLLVEGGAELNGSLFPLDVIDELFLTLAPKIKLGRNLPTYAGGEPLPGDTMQLYEIIHHQMVENEIYVRYRRKWETD
ncbi:MAG: RibD family protein [Armatimonadetes bacterium]|nr:RibD family protein [Armatimonadota bacterium]